MTTSRHRLTSRIILLDEGGAALLLLTAAPDTVAPPRWITPGGGVDPGESHLEGGIRELREETGLVVDDLGDPVWTHDFTVPWDSADHDTGHAEYYVHRTARFAIDRSGWTDDEQVDVTAERWFTAEELETGHVPFEPAELPALIRALR